MNKNKSKIKNKTQNIPPKQEITLFPCPQFVRYNVYVQAFLDDFVLFFPSYV